MSARTTSAPPPPRVEVKPPKPSKNAAWIDGYWQRDREWIWSPGFWRVPEADIAAEQTVEAPIAPPPVKVEQPPPPPAAAVAEPPPPPSATTVTVTTTTTSTPPSPPPPPATTAVTATTNLVWTPGYWAWNGSAYIWIEGAWRIPPQRGARWVAPTWTPRRGRVVLVPGGWSVRVGR
jgi:hypothetical protein